MIVTRCPGSCGELIQGYIYGGEKLISYPIELYSYVTLKEGKGQLNYPKANTILNKVFQHFGVSKKHTEIFIEINSEIPIGKGMASSTADLAATAIAAAEYIGEELSEKEILKLCIEIEPTDSIIFKEITLLDHIEGSYVKSYSRLPKCKVLLLKGKGTVDTLVFHKQNLKDKLIENRENLEKAINHFERGMNFRDIYEIGKGATISSLANQGILYKSGLEDICQICEALGGAGVNIAHSGTVIGLLYEENKFDKEKFLYILKGKEYFKDYEDIKEYDLAPGGVELMYK